MTYYYLTASILPSTPRITSPRSYPESYSIGTLTTSSDTYHRNIHQHIIALFQRTATKLGRRLISMFPIHSLPPSPQKRHGSSHRPTKIFTVIRGSASYGFSMSIQSKTTLWIVGGCQYIRSSIRYLDLTSTSILSCLP